MPKYIVNGKTYNIPDDKVEGFERKYPDANVEYNNDGKTYHIPINKREGFLKQYPNAVAGSFDQPTQQESAPIATPQSNEEEYIKGFGAGVKQGTQQLGAGLKYAGGEALDLVSQTAKDNADALAALEQMQAEGKDVAEETKTDAKSVLLPLLGHSSPAIDMVSRLFGKKNPIANANAEVATDRTIRRALKETNGDVEAAKTLLAERANEQTTADIWKEEAAQKMNEAKPTKGFGAWVGNMVPQMAGTLAGLGLSAVTKSPVPAQVLGLGQMGALTASTAGAAMKEARDAGATNGEVWATGLADAAVELATEAIPFKRYISPLVNQARTKVAKEMVDAVLDGKSPARNELQELLTKANEQLGGKLFSKKNVWDYIEDVGAEGLSEFTAEALQTITPKIYAEPENYPTLWEVVNNGVEGLKGGIFMGAILGGASNAATNKAQRDRRKQQGFVDVAEVKFSDEQNDTGIAEVLSYDPKTNQASVLFDGEVIPIDNASENIINSHRFTFDEFDRGQIDMEQAESYENGRSLETPQEKNDAYNMYESQAQNMRRVFGLNEDEDVDAFIGDDPLGFAMQRRNENPDDGQAVLDYLNAKATRDGMLDATNDKIDETIAQSNATIDRRKSQTDGLIHPAILKGANAENDRRVYIISGQVSTIEGSRDIDTEKSDKTIIVEDAETGKKEFAEPSALLSIDEALDPEQEKAAAAEVISNTISEQAEREIEGILPFNVGESYTILDTEGAQHTVTILADTQDGNVQVSLDNAQEVVVMPKEQIQQMSEAYNIGRTASVVEAKKAMEQSVAPAEQVAEQAAPTPRIPLNELGEPMYEQAPVYDTWVELVELNEGNEDEAIDTANIMRDNAQAELDKAMKSPKVKGKTVSEIQAAKAEQKALIKQAQDKLNYWTDVANYRDAQIELMKRAGQRATIAKAQAASQEKGRYSEENAALGAPIDFRDYVMRAIATGGIRFIWKDSATGTRGLGSHTGLKSNEERNARIWLLNNENGLYPEEAAEQLLTSYAEELGYTPNIDTMDALSEILDVVGSYATPSSMFEAAQLRHADLEAETAAQDEADAQARVLTPIAESLGLTLDEYLAWEEMMYAETLPAFEADYEQITAIFVEAAQQEEILNQNNDERSTENADVQSSVHSEGGLSDGSQAGVGVLQGTQVDNGIADSRGAEAGQGDDAQAIDAGTNDISTTEVSERADLADFPRADKATQERFREERAKFFTSDSEYAQVLKGASTVEDALVEFWRRAERAKQRDDKNGVERYESFASVLAKRVKYTEAEDNTLGDRGSIEAEQGSNESNVGEGVTDVPSADVSGAEEVDNQGNPINPDGSLKLEKVESIDDMTDEDFENPYRNIELPTLPGNVADAIGSKGKSVVIKKNIFERNIIRHSDLTPDQSRDILKSALYSPNLYGQNQKKRKPYNWVVVSTKDANGQNKLVLLEISDRKNNIEIVHWHYVDARGLEKLKRQAEREDGQLLILPSEFSEEVGALSDPTLSMPSESKDTTTEQQKQEVEQKNDDHRIVFGAFGKDYISEDGKNSFRITQIDGEKRVANVNVNTEAVGADNLEMTFEEIANLFRNGQWVEASTSQVQGADIVTINKDKHTKTGEDLYVAKIKDRVSRDEYNRIKGIAKEHNGYYSTTKRGFIFKTEADAEAFRLATQIPSEQTEDAKDVSLAELRDVGSATNDIVESTTSRSTEPQWEYELTVYDNGSTILERSQIMPNGVPVYDANFDVRAANPREMLDILNNPSNNMQAVLEQVGSRLEQRATVWDFREKARTEGVNGFKVGDTVKYTYNGKQEVGTIYDFEDYGDHNPILDLGTAPVLYVSAQWDQVEKTNEQPTIEQPKTSTPSGNKLVTDERYEELKRKMRQKLGGQMNMGIDPEILAIGTEMAVYHIEKGARKFADYASAMIADLGDMIRPYLKAFYNGARELPEVESAGYAAEMTSYDDVRTFDVANFDKDVSDAMATAEAVTKEQEVAQQVDVAKEKIKNNRNKARKPRNKSVPSSEVMDLFGSTEQENTQEYDLRGDDAVRSEGLPADGDEKRGDRSERTDREAASQEREGVDRRRASGGERVSAEVSSSDGRPDGRIQGLSNPKNTRNNHVERGEIVAPTSVDARIEANIRAIELSQQLIANEQEATPEQMVVLRRFSGWGGLGKAFNDGSYSRRIQELLGADAYQEAIKSANSSYYTPTYVVDALWDIAKQLGFEGGNILEGSAGIGNILGQMPTDISQRSDIRAIEIDSTAGNILSLLYPDAQVNIQGFEQTHIPNGSVDLAITNVPFVTGLRVNDTSGDKDLSKKFHNIHDFCIAKNVRKLREGGIGIFITSNGTLDNSNKLREWVVNQGGADFVGAFRLNNKTFIGTSVTSDIIVIRKRVNAQVSPNAIDVNDVSSVRSAEYDTGETRKVKGVETHIIKPLAMDYNKYFIDNPNNMAGEMRFGFEEGDTFRPTSKGLYPTANKDQSQMLQEFVQSFTPEAFTTRHENGIQESEEIAKLLDGKKLGEVFVNEGNLYITTTDGVRPLDVNSNKVKGHSKAECFSAYAAIKDAVREVLDYQTQNASDKGLQPLLDKLNKAYDNFVKTYGHFNKNTAIAFLRNDVDYPNVFSLEIYDEIGDGKGGRIQKFKKSDVFKKRVVEKQTEPQPTNIKDGIIASIFKFGRIDIPYLANQLNKSEAAVKEGIVESGYGFENPVTREVEVSFQYLSGNIREKLRQAEDNNDNGQYDGNIKALQKVVPMDIPAHLIDFTLGSSWVNPRLYDEYVKDRTDIDVQFTSVGGTWFMDAPEYGLNKEKNRAMGVVSTMLHKTIMGHTLIEAAIQNRTITVSQTSRKWDGTTETITDKEATQACAAKIDEIRQDFKDWARQKMQSDMEMSAQMERVYNDTFNNYVPMTIPDEFIPEYFGGATHKFKMRPHQGRAIVRGTMQPLMLAHEVGTGKTFTLISIAMEMRRLGTARKPMIVVQNATVGQFVASAKELYPNAKILTLEEGDRSAEGRKNFYAKIRYNDWDMIVVPQSTFEFIPDSEERQIAYIQDKIDEKMAVLDMMKQADGNSRSLITRQAEKEIEDLETQLAIIAKESSEKRSAAEEKRRAVSLQNAEVRAAEMLDRRTDDIENFDDMGIDALLIDEAHEYKHLGFATAMQRGVKGVDPSYSKKSQGVYLKTQAVMEKNNGKNVIFATGTPISNTAAEIWTFMRYLMPEDTMIEYGIYYFDDFVRNFGNIQQMLEFTTSGKFKESNRFAGYVNLPELIRIWSGVSDTVLTREAEDVSNKIPEIEGGKAQDLYLPQTRALRGIMKFVKAQLEAYDKMSGKQKKENSHIPLTMYGIAKAAAVDARLVQSDAEDDVNSKTNEAVRQTLRSLQETEDYKGTIAIFADNYQNKRSGFNIYEDIRSKLIDQGVPASEVVVIKPGLSVKRKLEIFDKVNKGEIRVVLGSTFTLGTGVNIQERLHTLIHLDAPNRPMDYTQRNGRILRQGNLHKEMENPVRILRFGVEDSLDVTAYQRLKTKGAIADSVMNGKQFLSDSMANRVLEEEEDAFGDTVAQLSGSEYAMLKNNAEKNVRKYESRRKQWEADQTYIHNAKPRLASKIENAKQILDEQRGYLDKVQNEFKDGKFKTITIGEDTFASVSAMDDFIKEYNKTILDAQKQLKDGALLGPQTRTLPIKVDGYTFNVTTTIEKEMSQSGGQLFSEVHRKMSYSCVDLGLENIPVRQSLLRNAIEDITENVITGKDFEENIEALEHSITSNQAELDQLVIREGKPFEFNKELEKAKAQYKEYSELMKKEMEEKEAKYAEMDASVEAAQSLAEAEEDDEYRYRVVSHEQQIADEVYDKTQKIADAYEISSNIVVADTKESFVKKFRDAGIEEAFIDKDAAAVYLPTTGEIVINSQYVIDDADLVNSIIHEEVHSNTHNAEVWHRIGDAIIPVGEERFVQFADEILGENLSPIKSADEIIATFVGKAAVLQTEDGKYLVRALLSGNVTSDEILGYLREYFPDIYVKYGDVMEAMHPFIKENLETIKAQSNGRRSNVSVSRFNTEGNTSGNNSRDSETPALDQRSTTDRGVTAARRGNGEEKEEIVSAATDLAASLGVKLNVIEDVNDITDRNARQRLAKRGVKARYNVATGQVYFVLPNATSVEDAVRTVLHEVVAHKGLRDVVGREHFEEFLGKVFRAADTDTRRKIVALAAQNRWNFNEATEEYLASLAEEGFDSRENRTFLQKVRDLFMDMLRAAKIALGFNINDNDLRYMLWRTYQMQRSQGAMAVAEDVVVQHKLGVGNYRYRSVKPSTPSTGEARHLYDDAVRRYNKENNIKKTENLWHHLREAYQDSMLSVQKLVDAVLTETGNTLRSSDDVYKAENQLSSKNKAEIEKWERDFMKPLQMEILNLVKKGASYDDIVEYLMAKHGLERNLEFSRREDEENGKEWDGSVKRDYSGLTELTGEAEHFTEAAQQIVDEFEGKYNTDNLWSKINAATKESLRKSYDSGLMSKETYDKVSTMFKYYVPLRGWDSNVAADQYEYMGNKGMKILPVLKTAKGRTSRADDPIATLGSVGESSIIQGNRNLMKLKFLNFAQNNPTSLLTVSEQWYEQNADGTWKPSNPEIPTDATADEVDALVKEHEAKMEALGDKATKKRQGLNIDLHTTKWEQEEHAVNVKRNGKEYKIFVNGNPIAAQAINGFTNPNANKKDSWEWIEQRATAVKNFMARAFTSMNPAFIFTNLARDLVWAGTSVAIKENAAYARQYTKNISEAMIKAQLPRLVSKWKNGTLDMNVPIEKHFNEFVANGGETGFTQLNTVDDYKRNMERFIKEAQGGTAIRFKKGWRWIWDNVEFLNRSAEDTTRFMVYLTSRQMGRSITESVANAKDITVNFNKKGRGTMGANVLGFAYIFFNATIQSLANFGKLIANHPKKTTAALTTFASAGMIAPMVALSLQAMLSGDDDEPTYWDLPEWVRRNNIVIYVGGSGYVTIPLPHELRPFYGMGELAFSTLMGKEEPEVALQKAVEGFASLMPFDYTGNAGNAIVNFTPTIAQPLAQLVVNKDYFGTPIYRKTAFNEMDPEWTKAYKSTNQYLVDATEFINELTGGDEVKSGIVDLNPAVIEHLFEGYLGGVAKTINRTAKTFSMFWDEDARAWRNVPVLSSFYNEADERTSGSQVNREYFAATDEADEVEHLYSGYKKRAKIGSMEYAEKLSELVNSDVFKRYQTVNSYQKAVSKLNAALKDADNTDREEIETLIMELKVDMLEELDAMDNK